MTAGIGAVCVFCSASSAIDPRYLALADEVGAEIARRGWTLVSGGGSVSMMGALARSARRRGGRTIGVIPEGLLSWEVADHDADELVVTRDMRHRKGVMDERCDAYLALPGGIGTLEELLEAWTGRTLLMHAKPVVVLDPWGDLAGLRALADQLVRSGFMRPSAAAELAWASSVGEAMTLLMSIGAPVVPDRATHRAEEVESSD